MWGLKKQTWGWTFHSNYQRRTTELNHQDSCCYFYNQKASGSRIPSTLPRSRRHHLLGASPPTANPDLTVWAGKWNPCACCGSCDHMLGPLLMMPQKTKSVYHMLANRNRGGSRDVTTAIFLVSYLVTWLMKPKLHWNLFSRDPGKHSIYFPNVEGTERYPRTMFSTLLDILDCKICLTHTYVQSHLCLPGIKDSQGNEMVPDGF